jgi:hypothetical protein
MLQTEAQSPKAAPVTKPKMSAHEIDQLMGQFNNLGEIIASVGEYEGKLKSADQ